MQGHVVSRCYWGHANAIHPPAQPGAAPDELLRTTLALENLTVLQPIIPETWRAWSAWSAWSAWRGRASDSCSTEKSSIDFIPKTGKKKSQTGIRSKVIRCHSMSFDVIRCHSMSFKPSKPKLLEKSHATPRKLPRDLGPHVETSSNHGSKMFKDVQKKWKHRAKFELQRNQFRAKQASADPLLTSGVWRVSLIPHICQMFFSAEWPFGGCIYTVYMVYHGISYFQAHPHSL